MCRKCIRAVKMYFPDCPKRLVPDFLMTATAFPFGHPETVREQLKEAKEAGCITYEDAIAYACQQMDTQMREFWEKYDK